MRLIVPDKCTRQDSKLSICDSAQLVNAVHWNKVVDNSNIYLSLEYLSALEKSMQEEIGFRYIIFYNNLLQPVAVGYVQLVHFIEKGIKVRKALCRIGDEIRNKFLKTVDLKALVCGNIFACGENGFAFTKHIKPSDAFQLLADGMKRLSQDEEKNGQVSFVLMKEFWPSSVKLSDHLKENNYRGFRIDVNMVMNISPFWKKMDDYLACLNSKFRTKAKRVYAKSDKIRVRDLNAADINSSKIRIEELYNNVFSRAEYKFGKLNCDVFAGLKQNLKEQHIFRAYYIGEKMIGFSSVFYFNQVLDAGYVGLDYEYNGNYATYQRMLYDFVDVSIRLGARELRLGRTAELIKSSIGANPVNMQLYIKHRNDISNKLLKPFLTSISPAEFELRNPFKAGYNNY